MILKPAPMSTKQITWYPNQNLGVAWASETNGLGRVYDDACDEGLTLVSHRTGEEVVMVVQEDTCDDEGDILSWTLRPVDPKHTFRLCVYNT
jgi:hypothetical protein